MTATTARRGQALVEFALVIPVFLLLIFGIIDAGRLIYTYNAVSNSARNAARVAIVNQAASGTDTCDTTAPTAYAVGCAVASSGGITVAPADVDVVYTDYLGGGECGDGTPDGYVIGCVVSVTVSAPWTPLTPIIGQIVSPITLSSTTKMPIERVCSSSC